MSTVAWRRPALEQMLPTILPQVDRLNVYLQGYDSTPDCLRDPKINVVDGRSHPEWTDLKSTAKLFWIAQGLVAPGVHLTVDDDILYPPAYASVCAARIERFGRKAAVGFHGGRYHADVKHIYRDRDEWHFEKACPADVSVHTIGSGTIAWHTDTLRLTLADLTDWDAIDFRIAIAAQKQKVPMVCLARSAGYLKALPLASDLRSCSGLDSYLERMLGFQHEWKNWQAFPFENELGTRPVFVIMPCFNEDPVRVMRSVESALATPGVDRVRVVDDGSAIPLELPPTDRVVVIRRGNNGGPSAALNSGIRTLPQDAIVCRLDVGDTFYPDVKGKQIEEVRSGRARALFAWHYDPVRNFTRKPDANWQRNVFIDNQFGSTTSVFERSVWEEVGGFDDSVRWTDDWRFAVKVQFLVGWSEFAEVAGEHGMYPGGHSDVDGDPVRKAARAKDYTATVELARALGNPRAYRYLFDPKWCRKRGLVPLQMPKPK